MPDPVPNAEQHATRRLPSRLLRHGLLAAFVLTAVAVVAFVDIPSLDTSRRWAHQLGPWAVVVFFFAYVLITQFPVPRTALTLTSGVLFGPVVGIIVALLATTMSAALSLTMLRSLVVASPDKNSSFLQRILLRSSAREHPALARINARLEQRGGVAVFFLRLIAGLPFSVLNYACVLTPVRLRSFVIATFFGSAPSTIAGVLLGDALTDHHDSRMLWVLGILFVVGIIGLVVDSLVPVKSEA